jgi:ribosomal protein S18 acetylase RimI-like enzyme
LQIAAENGKIEKSPDGGWQAMDVHPATLAELNACLSINHNCTTDHVWQMQAQKAESRVSVAFEVVRLPRRMRVEYPRSLEQLVEHWQHDEGFFVAEFDGQVRGYVDVISRPWEHTGWVANLAVDREYRRQQIGTKLLGQARQWAKEEGLKGLLLEATTKNYPALCLYEKLGFQFCGFNDHYYENQDIALFFVQMIR